MKNETRRLKESNKWLWVVASFNFFLLLWTSMVGTGFSEHYEEKLRTLESRVYNRQLDTQGYAAAIGDLIRIHRHKGMYGETTYELEDTRLSPHKPTLPSL